MSAGQSSVRSSRVYTGIYVLCLLSFSLAVVHYELILVDRYRATAIRRLVYDSVAELSQLFVGWGGHEGARSFGWLWGAGLDDRVKGLVLIWTRPIDYTFPERCLVTFQDESPRLGQRD